MKNVYKKDYDSKLKQFVLIPRDSEYEKYYMNEQYVKVHKDIRYSELALLNEDDERKFQIMNAVKEG